MGTSGVRLARLLALANVALADTAIAVWDSKYHHVFWRPVTRIREADEAAAQRARATGTATRGIGSRRSERRPAASPARTSRRRSRPTPPATRGSGGRSSSSSGTSTARTRSPSRSCRTSTTGARWRTTARPVPSSSGASRP
jgi:hypothetical protein